MLDRINESGQLLLVFYIHVNVTHSPLRSLSLCLGFAGDAAVDTATFVLFTAADKLLEIKDPNQPGVWAARAQQNPVKPWCSDCRVAEPMIEEMLKKYKAEDHVILIRLTKDDYAKAKEEYDGSLLSGGAGQPDRTSK